jgi:feruloyl esterase
VSRYVAVLVESTRMSFSFRRHVLAAGLAIASAALLPSPASAQPADAPPTLPAIAATVPCTSLAAADLQGVVDRPVHIRAAAEVTAGEAHPYCQVEGVIEPAVAFEVHLPVSGWTGRYVQLGCGGLCGMLHVRLNDHESSCVPAANGELVLASTDMGHEGGNDGTWAAGNPQARIDFAYRGVHVTALVAKALIARYYGQAPRYSYFSGCSDGGREALMEAQRYPNDFNGIAAGAAALNFTVQNSFYHAWNALSNTAANGTPILLASRLPILHAAALAACDALDGLKDGLIEDPRRCHFNPAAAQCRTGQDRAGCLTAAEVEVARRIYAGAHDANGRKLVVGGPMPGSELSWAGVYVPRAAGDHIFSATIADGSIRYLYYPDPLPSSWTLKDLKFDQATLDGYPYRGIYDATNPDLSGFAGAGGRLLMWHGWSDPHISPLNSIAYYTAVQQQMGAPKTAQFLRLFLMPGLYHCSGGDGLATFDVLTPLMAWVERGTAPDRLLAAHDNARPPPQGPPPEPGAAPTGVNRTRPVFAYPKLARYAGSGSMNDAGNFVAADPAQPPPAPVEWLGARYMRPGLQQTCEANGLTLTCKDAR